MSDQAIYWYDVPFTADRRMSLTLWPNGELTCVMRLRPTYTWSPPVTVGSDVSEEEAAQFAATHGFVREPGS